MHEITPSLLNRFSLDQLASVQQAQGLTNNCALYTITSLLNLQLGSQLDGAALAEQINAGWLPKPFVYRVAPNWATTPRQAQRVLYMLARRETFRLQTQLRTTRDAYLRDILAYSRNTYPIVTLWWLRNGPKMLSHRNEREIYKQPVKGPGAHTMLLAAYDSSHTNQIGQPYPWGFVNSWADESYTDIFWMDEATWQRLYKIKTLLVRFG
jgi:hypothetical protein